MQFRAHLTMLWIYFAFSLYLEVDFNTRMQIFLSTHLLLWFCTIKTVYIHLFYISTQCGHQKGLLESCIYHPLFDVQSNFRGRISGKKLYILVAIHEGYILVNFQRNWRSRCWVILDRRMGGDEGGDRGSWIIPRDHLIRHQSTVT